MSALKNLIRLIGSAQMQKQVEQFQLKVIRIISSTDKDNEEHNNEELVRKGDEKTAEDNRAVIELI